MKYLCHFELGTQIMNIKNKYGSLYAHRDRCSDGCFGALSGLHVYVGGGKIFHFLMVNSLCQLVD